MVYSAPTHNADSHHGKPRRGIAQVQTDPALYLSEFIGNHDEFGNLFNLLNEDDKQAVLERALFRVFPPNSPVFTQGQRYDGIWLIEGGTVRTYYLSPFGREYTLAYWGAGHFVGVPEICQSGYHLWSGGTVETTRLYFLSSVDIRNLIKEKSTFAIALVEGLVYKGRCLSAILQILSTRSMQSRLARLLIILACGDGGPPANELPVRRVVTHEELASIIGSTRQWVTATLKKFERQSLIAVRNRRIVIRSVSALSELAD